MPTADTTNAGPQPVDTARTHTAWDVRLNLHAWTDPWGNRLSGYVVHGSRTLTETGRYRYNDGYGLVVTVEAVDEQGRRYYKRLPVGYHEPAVWIRIDPDGDERVRWDTRLPTGRTRLVNPDGTPFGQPSDER